jgi:hypothetical protein
MEHGQDAQPLLKEVPQPETRTSLKKKRVTIDERFNQYH